MFDESGYRARDCMSRDISVVHPETPLRRVVQLMADRAIGGLPVVDGNGQLVGMLTEGDLVRWREGFPASEEHWLETLGEGFEVAPDFLDMLRAERHTARHVMRPGPVVTITEDMPAREIASLLHDKGIKRVPVVADGRIIGIVSRSDLVRMLARWLDEQEEERHRGALPATGAARPAAPAPRPTPKPGEPHHGELPVVHTTDAVLGLVGAVLPGRHDGPDSPKRR